MRVDPFGPWTTALSPPSGAGLSAHWARRLGTLPDLRATPAAPTRRARYGVLALAAAALSLPSLHEGPVTGAVEAAQPPSAPTAGAVAKPGGEGQARDEVLEAYRLAPGQDLKLMPKPRPDGLRDWLNRERAGQGERLNEITSMTFRWRDPDRLQQWSAQYGSGGGWRVRDLPRYLEMNAYEFEIEGDPDLLKTEVGGDWVYREGVPAERMARSLEAVLREALKEPVVLEFREVERDVVVARGRYRHSPVAGRANDQIEIYGKQIVEGGGGAGGGSGDFPEFLKWVGAWVERPVVNEVKVPPRGNVSWAYNERKPSTKQSRSEDHDEELVLQHLNEQTGLTFTRERAMVRILSVGRAK